MYFSAAETRSLCVAFQTPGGRRGRERDTKEEESRDQQPAAAEKTLLCSPSALQPGGMQRAREAVRRKWWTDLPVLRKLPKRTPGRERT